MSGTVIRHTDPKAGKHRKKAQRPIHYSKTGSMSP